MLGGDEIAAHVSGELDGSLEHALGADGEGHISGRPGGGGIAATGRLGPDGPDGLSGAVDGDAGAEEAVWRAVLGDEAEEEVLGEDHVPTEGTGLPLREDDCLDGPLSEALEDGRHGPPGAPPGAKGGDGDGGAAKGEEGGAAATVEEGPGRGGSGDDRDRGGAAEGEGRAGTGGTATGGERGGVHGMDGEDGRGVGAAARLHPGKSRG